MRRLIIFLLIIASPIIILILHTNYVVGLDDFNDANLVELVENLQNNEYFSPYFQELSLEQITEGSYDKTSTYRLTGTGTALFSSLSNIEKQGIFYEFSNQQRISKDVSCGRSKFCTIIEVLIKDQVEVQPFKRKL
ncbi:hypothetical protein ACFSCX_19810 [Bacillus salitolerans]|uniref:Uncharacterized protein n=1 Tax=Bacillus salitolerans TaxID=1437434 RepID=A0ABW4LUH5_9BACI